MNKPCEVYRRVKIYRVKEELPGSSLKELKDGSMVPCRPKYDISYQYTNGYPEPTIEAVKQEIDKFITKCMTKYQCKEKILVSVLNRESV